MRDIKVQKGFVPDGSKSTPQYVFIVGPGVSVAELYRVAAANGFAVVGGLSPTVGATGGWILGGGVGMLLHWVDDWHILTDWERSFCSSFRNGRGQ